MAFKEDTIENYISATTAEMVNSLSERSNKKLSMIGYVLFVVSTPEMLCK
jgi:hypothetical protein